MEIYSIGFLAGLALAIPLGPMAIMLITTTISSGRRVALVAALAMASVDFTYSILVFTLGDYLISSLSNWLFELRLAGSALLVLVAIKIAFDAKKASRETNKKEVKTSKSALVTFTTFFGLTVINPATAFYFVGITPSVSAISGTNLLLDAVSFGAGVYSGSILWQLFLIFASHLVSKAMSPRLQAWLQYLGAFLIVGLAIWLLTK
ncbi:MAG: LysE family translocator [Rhodoluna sp.]